MTSLAPLFQRRVLNFSLLLATGLFALLSSFVGASEFTVDATKVGYIRRVPGFTYRNFADEGYLTGSQGNGILHTDNNSYFIFDLSSVSGTITAAEFRVYTSNERPDVPEGGYWSTSASEQFVLHEVTTNASELDGFPTTQHNVGSPEYSQLEAMFADLGNGPVWGMTVMTEAEAEAVPGTVPNQSGGKIWQIPLSGNALASLNAASGLWAMGGTLADTALPISNITELLFGGSAPYSTVPDRATPVPQLVLTVTPGLSADFDGSGEVDGRDFLIWQRGFGLTGQTSNNLGDADGDGSIADKDLTIWHTQYGASALLATATSVPEPTMPTLLALLLGIAASIRRCDHDYTAIHT